MISEYVYTLTHGWQAQPTSRLPASAASTGEALHALGYTWIAESAPSECGVGHFYVWQREVPAPGWPRYAADCAQIGDAAIVWLADLPTLWDWIRLYGPVAVLLQRHDWEDEDDDDEDEVEGPSCPDCGEVMHRVPLVPLQQQAKKSGLKFAE